MCYNFSPVFWIFQLGRVVRGSSHQIYFKPVFESVEFPTTRNKMFSALKSLLFKDKTDRLADAENTSLQAASTTADGKETLPQILFFPHKLIASRAAAKPYVPEYIGRFPLFLACSVLAVASHVTTLCSIRCTRVADGSCGRD